MPTTTRPSGNRSAKATKKYAPLYLISDLLLISIVVACFVLLQHFDADLEAAAVPSYGERIEAINEEYYDLCEKYENRNTDASINSAQEEYLEERKEELTNGLAAAQVRYAEAAAALGPIQEEYDALCAEVDDLVEFPAQIEAFRHEYGALIRELEDKIQAGESSYRICYLTFDDGPSYLTDRFVEKLNSYGAYATFFTCNVNLPEYEYDYRDSLFRMEASSGHTVANHSNTHTFDGSLYWGLDYFIEDVQAQDQLVYDVTGMHTQVFRFPSGSYYCPFRTSAIEALHDMGMDYMDWTGNCYDAGSNGYSSSYTADVIVTQARRESVIVILCHDWKETTLYALDTAIPTLQEENTLFLPLFIESCTMGEATKPKWDN